MLFKSEERIKRLLEEINNLKSELRAKDRDQVLLTERLQKINEDLLTKERALKMREAQEQEQQAKNDDEERTVVK